MNKVFQALLTLLLFTLPGACAFDLVRVEQLPVTLDVTTDHAAAFVLEKGADFPLTTGYNRSLKAGTKWTLVGALPQGAVYKTVDQVLTVEGSNIYEAYIVVSAGALVGFYLPAEKTFSPLNKPVLLQ